MRMMPAMAAVALALATAGCSSGSGGQAEPAPPDEEPTMSFGDLHDQAVTLQRDYGEGSLTPAHDMPTNGLATYSGVVAYSMSSDEASAILNDPDMMSLIALSLDFGDQEVTGRLHDFVRRDGTDLGGEIELVGSLQGNHLEAGATGDLSESGALVSYRGGIAADFRGGAGEVIVGAASLIAMTPDSSYTVHGAFVAD